MEESAGAIINYEGKYLVICGRNGTWGFPKGHLEGKETPAQAAIREVKEEVGLTIKLDETKKHVFEYPLENGTTKRVTYFLAHSTTDKIATNNELVATKWLSPADTIKQISFDNLRDAFKKMIGMH